MYVNDDDSGGVKHYAWITNSFVNRPSVMRIELKLLNEFLFLFRVQQIQGFFWFLNWIDRFVIQIRTDQTNK